MNAHSRQNRWFLLMPALVAAWSAGAGTQKTDLAAWPADAVERLTRTRRLRIAAFEAL